MADPALDSHPDTYQLLPDWDSYPAVTPTMVKARDGYVARCVQRAIDEGIAPLYAIMSCPFADQQDAGIAALKRIAPSVTLRLREGVAPPNTDAQGRPLKEPERGKVLRVKIGNVQIETGTQRAELERAGGLFLTRDITAHPTSLALEEAVIVWRRWGYRYREAELGSSGHNTWLVMQVQSDGSPYAPRESAPAPSREPRRNKGGL